MANNCRPIIRGYSKLRSSELRTPNSELYPLNFKRMLSVWKLLGVWVMLFCLSACAPSIQNQEQAQVHMRLGNSMLQEGRPTQALAELVKAVDLDPNNPVIRNLLGIAYLEKGMFRPARDQFEKALYLDPEYVEIHNNLGTALLRDGNVPESIKEFNLALNNPLYTTPHFAQYNLGQAYYALKDYGKAKNYYQEAINSSPTFSLAYHGLGLALKAANQPAEASEALKKAIEYAPTFAQAHYDLGEVLLELNQQSLARMAFKAVIRLVPESDLGRKALKRLKDLP
jgi:Tfp pilus assembly protein PilF